MKKIDVDKIIEIQNSAKGKNIHTKKLCDIVKHTPKKIKTHIHKDIWNKHNEII